MNQNIIKQKEMKIFYDIQKNSYIIIFQSSPLQVKLFIQYNIDIFADGTFKITLKCGYQVFITRTYVKELNNFYTISFSILKKIKNKELSKCYLKK